MVSRVTAVSPAPEALLRPRWGLYSGADVKQDDRSSRGHRRISPGQTQLLFAFDLRLSQIPADWHQIAVRFTRANGIRDGDKERSIW